MHITMSDSAANTVPADLSTMESDKEVSKDRRARRELRTAHRQEEKLRKKVADIRAPKSQKLTVVTAETFEKLQKDTHTPIKEVKNKHFKASKTTQFALTDFVVKKVEKVKCSRRIPGTTVPALKKGKIREIPKKKSLSKLKRAIVEIRKKRKKELEYGIVDPSEQEKVPNVTEEIVPEPSPLEVEDPVQTVPLTFSRKFRSYCDHANIPDIRVHAEKLLGDLFRFQDRAYDKNQIKARAHRRYIVGFKEVERSMEINKVKLLIIATDLEPNPGTGGLDETVEKLKEICKEKAIHYCFPLQRRKIGYLLFKKAPISCVGILDYDGAEEHVKALLKLVRGSRNSLSKEMEKLKIN